MSEFEKWSRRNWKGYSFTRWKKSFGLRLVGKYDRGRWRNGRIVLIYNFQGRPAIEDFAEFFKDFEKFYDQYEGNFEIDGAYFVLHGEYDRKAFNLLLKNFDEDLRSLVQIKLFEEKGAHSTIKLLKGNSESSPKGTIQEESEKETHSGKVPSLTQNEKEIIIHRVGTICCYPNCKETISLDVHHIVPREQGGTDKDSNLIVLCPVHHRYADREAIPRKRLEMNNVTRMEEKRRI